jgi:hypothetical protein
MKIGRWRRWNKRSSYQFFSNPLEACQGADLVTTDVWTSMGYEAENEARKKAFADWCVDAEMMAAAKPDALFMHCLPAHRGEEVEADVIDGPQSVVWDEAENRMHVQKALMEYLLLGRHGGQGGQALRRKHKPGQQRQRRGQRPAAARSAAQLRRAVSSPVADSAYTVPSAPTATSRAAMPGTSAMAICQLKPSGANSGSSAWPNWPARLYSMAGPVAPSAAPGSWTGTTAAPSAPG